MLSIYDVLIIGGGPAGVMAAAKAAESGVKVLLLEKNERLGKKMLITGGGRCNLTNEADVNEMVANIPGNGRFVYSSLHQFSGQDLRALLNKLNVKTKVEDNGRVFPVTDKAVDVVTALEQHLRRLGVHIHYNSRVEALLVEDDKCCGVKVNDKEILSKSVIVATGGLSYPSTGSTGEGYKMAKRVGHRVTKLFPAAVAITCNDAWIVDREVQGVSLSNVKITLFNNRGKKLASEVGDIIMTHWGISGPGTLRVGRVVALEGQGEQTEPIRGEIDLLPRLTGEELEQELNQIILAGGKRSLKNLLSSLLPERLAKVVVSLVKLSPDMAGSQLSKASIKTLASLIKSLPIHVKGTRPIEEATVTGGGIHIKEIDPRTMESKLVKGLFFAGEILDVDAHTGGFNMQVAFSTGFAAGKAAASFVNRNS